MKDKTVTVIQARRGSSRLPDKVTMDLAGATVLERMVERVLAAKLSGTVVVATTTDSQDDLIEEICLRRNFEIFRGHPTDLLDRHFKVAEKYQADFVVKIPSDCPLIDPKIIDQVIKVFLQTGDLDFCSNLHPATHPDGNDVEIMTFAAIKKAHLNAKKNFEREHTTPYIWENAEQFSIFNVTYEKDFSMSHRWVLDYPEDYEFISTVYNRLYAQNPEFDIDDILALLEKEPELSAINAKYNGVNWYRHHLNELKTVDSSQTKTPTSQSKTQPKNQSKEVQNVT